MRRAIRSLLILKLRYTFNRDGIFYFQRRVPLALQGRYPKKFVKHNLNTGDPAVARVRVAELIRRYEAEWAAMLRDPQASPQAAHVQAVALLRDYGLTPHSHDNDEHALSAFIDPLRAAGEAFAEGCEQTYQDAEPASYLNPVQLAALELLNPVKKDRMGDALEVYLQVHPKGNDPTFRRYAVRVVEFFLAAVGDKPIEALDRADAHRFKEFELARGQKTTTVRRRLSQLNAIFAQYLLERGKQYRERGILIENPFHRIGINGEGEDAESGTPLTVDAWRKVYALCRVADDDERWLIALQLGTGARIAEVAGLTLAEIDLDSAVPQVIFTANSLRGMKKDKAASATRRAVVTHRAVPLVGPALWAAQRIKANASEGQVAAFPRYVKDGRVKADGASATVGKWLQVHGLPHSSHDFRHTLRDFLRAVECPKEIQDELGGWAKEDIGSRVYGVGHQIVEDHLKLTQCDR